MIIIGSNKIIAMTNNEVEKIKFFLTSFFSFYLVKIHKKQRNKLCKIYRQRFH